MDERGKEAFDFEKKKKRTQKRKTKHHHHLHFFPSPGLFLGRLFLARAQLLLRFERETPRTESAPPPSGVVRNSVTFVSGFPSPCKKKKQQKNKQKLSLRSRLFHYLFSLPAFTHTASPSLPLSLSFTPKLGGTKPQRKQQKRRNKPGTKRAKRN